MSVKFIRRTTIPKQGNKYYETSISNCTYSNKQLWPNSTLANCVSYGWGRWVESQSTNYYCSDLNMSSADMFAKRPRGDAKTIYTNCQSNSWFTTGTTPKVGALVCWKGGTGKYAGYGHVGFIEKVYADGKVDISDCTSSYYSSRVNGYFKYSPHVDPSSYLGSHYVLQGYVYPKVTFR